jgi:hypothetical protein
MLMIIATNIASRQHEAFMSGPAVHISRVEVKAKGVT